MVTAAAACSPSDEDIVRTNPVVRSAAPITITNELCFNIRISSHYNLIKIMPHFQFIKYITKLCEKAPIIECKKSLLNHW